jgi:putative two-component system response regulator
MPTSLPLGARILIIEDSEDNLRLLERILTREGYDQLSTTSDPQQAIPLFEQVTPDMVLLDLHMPLMDGFEIMEQIRARTPDVYLPILVLTGDESSEIKSRALSTGATDFLTKPFDKTEVLLRMKNLLETRKLHLDLEAKNLMLQMQAGQSRRDS